MRWVWSLGALVGFSGLALGSLPMDLGGDEAVERDVGNDDAVPVGRPHEVEDPVSVPDVMTADWLDDVHLDPCPERTHRMGGTGDQAGVPFVRLPRLSPPKGFDNFRAIQADSERARPFDETDAMRWCVNREDTPEGPAVISRMNGARRVFVRFADGQLEGAMRAWSYVPVEDGHATEAHREEMTGAYRKGEAHGEWTSSCEGHDMNAWCPVSANFSGSFDRGNRRGEWVWREESGPVMDEVRIPYHRNEPDGAATIRNRNGNRTCESRGEIHALGKDGTWTTRCGRGVEREDPVIEEYKAGKRISSTADE